MVYIRGIIALQPTRYYARRTTSMHCRMYSSMRVDLQSIFSHSVQSVRPSSLINNVVVTEQSTLTVNNVKYQLRNNVFIAGFGKAVLGMAHPITDLLQGHIQGGILSVPIGVRQKFAPVIKSLENHKIEVYEGAANNLPDEKSHCAAMKIKDLAARLDESDLLLVLISGGGSALLPLPKSDVTLDEKASVIKCLGSAGANITELNTVRKKLSQLKGGGLAKIAEPAQVVSLILSDVVGDPLEIIASGPTIENHDAPNAAFKIIEKYRLLNSIPYSVKSVLNSNDKQYNSTFPKVQNVIIGNNMMALQSAANEAKNLGYFPVVLTDSIQGFISDICMFYISIIRLLNQAVEGSISAKEFITQLSLAMSLKLCDNVWLTESVVQECVDAVKTKRGVCFILGGEPTVRVQGKGKGGRSQELCLRLALALHKLKSEVSLLEVMCLIAGTDGIDGPTDAAGAFSCVETIEQALSEGINPQDFINANDSYNFYSKIENGKDLIITGHTGTNVMDIHIIMFKLRNVAKI